MAQNKQEWILILYEYFASVTENLVLTTIRSVNDVTKPSIIKEQKQAQWQI